MRPEAMRERVGGQRKAAEVLDRFAAHLEANGVDLDKTPAVMGALLEVDPVTEGFLGEHAAEAATLATRPYRAPFVVPEKV